MFMCLWENSHFLCIKTHTNTNKIQRFLKGSPARRQEEMQMAAVPIDQCREDLGDVGADRRGPLEVAKTTPFLMMMIRAGWPRVFFSAGL